MPIKYVSDIPKNRKKSRFDDIIEEAVKMIDKDPTKMVEISGEGAGLMPRFKSFQAEGKFKIIQIKKRGESVYLSAIEE